MEVIDEDNEFIYIKQIVTKIHKKRKRYIDPEGYVRIFVGYDYHGSFRGYMREHKYIMQEYLKRELLKHETIHHKDGNKQNNDISNLEVIDNRNHGWYHHPRWKVKFKDLYPISPN